MLHVDQSIDHHPLAIAHRLTVNAVVIDMNAKFTGTPGKDATFALWMMFLLGRHAMFAQDTSKVKGASSLLNFAARLIMG